METPLSPHSSSSQMLQGVDPAQVHR